MGIIPKDSIDGKIEGVNGSAFSRRRRASASRSYADPKEEVRDTVEQWYAEHGEKKFVAYAFDLMERIHVDTSDAANVTEKTLPDYIESHMPLINEKVQSLTREGEVSGTGVVKVKTLLRTIAEIIKEKATPPNGIPIPPASTDYEKKNPY